MTGPCGRTPLVGVMISLFLATAAFGQPAVDITSDIPGVFIDIEETGIDLMLHDDDEAEIFTTIGNAVIPAGRVVVGNNGGLGFDPPDTELASSNGPLPNGSAFGGGQALLPYWDDIGNDIGAALWLEMDDRVIIQWERREVGGISTSFQVQIFDGSEQHNPAFQFLYRDISAAGGGASATIGYQDGGAGFLTDEWSFNVPGAVGDGVVLTATTPEPSSLMLLVSASGLLLGRRR